MSKKRKRTEELDRPEEEPQKDDKKSQADLLVELSTEVGAEFFHDQFSKSYVRLSAEDHWEVWPCRSKHFKTWLSGQYWHTYQKAPNSSALSDAINVLEAKARFEGDQYSLHNRVAFHKEAIYYDLADSKWRAVKVTPDGWEIVKHPPILFRRYAHQHPQVEPVPSGNLQDLIQFLNLRDPSQQLLVLVYVVSCLVPDIPHPIPVVYGPQGSAKSTFLRLLRRIVDPSAAEILSFPGSYRELVQQLAHHWSPFYDNVSRLSAGQSDALCRAVTGEGFSKRELYTDDEDVIYQFRCCPALDGINVVAAKPDLLDRSILFGLEQIPKEERKEEKVLLEQFEKVRPALFGAALDALSGAMLLLPSVHLPRLPRMADFARWGAAIAVALGYSQEEFLTALEENSRIRNDEVVMTNPVATAVLSLMESTTTWVGSATELLAKLVKVADKLLINRNNKIWPKAPHILTRRLNEIRLNLAEAGIHVITGGRDSKERCVVLVKDSGK